MAVLGQLNNRYAKGCFQIRKDQQGEMPRKKVVMKKGSRASSETVSPKEDERVHQ